MAAELASSRLDHDSHLLLEQPLLRLPQELLRKNFKTAQGHLERENKQILPLLKSAANASFQGADDTTTLSSLDGMITRLNTLKRKIETLHEEETGLHVASRRRLEHLSDLYKLDSLSDVKYDEWSHVRLNRLLVEYLVRQGYSDTARSLAREKGIEDLVDLDVFGRCERIAHELKMGSLEEALGWCAEHKVIMRRKDNKLEFELRLQQYIELCRQRKLVEAQQHGKKHFPPHLESQSQKIYFAAGLLAFPPDRQHQYTSWYSQARWDELAALFTETHHHLFSLPSRPLLLIALSAGLSALKTPSCHSKHTSSVANASSTTTSLCPICSAELNEVARKLPYAHHTKSYVEADPVVLPNGRVYGRDRLSEYCRKMGLPEDEIKDPTTSELFHVNELVKVYIT
ncbi:uncharacterized protein KY384_003720 [Bacidia gigantensis]|uniref:uncharacterized protein n=1 Tax=Bacidia gigantensis TaxID=2732470 RepID=UPI001D058CA1|nr:uncharacterized protein KY384_003720 [Bacidia gigantensis]KAG8532083.1 hypothetical protein KY384_003720 [Bacidia gigantensis]